LLIHSYFLQSVLDIYGDWLFEQRQFSEAALSTFLINSPSLFHYLQRSFAVFAEAEQSMKAISAHEEALEWRQSFDIATRESLPEDEIVAMGYRVAGRSFNWQVRFLLSRFSFQSACP
jgi:elongator complex protein 1